MHFAARAARSASRCASRSAYYRTNVTGTLTRARGDGRGRRPAVRLLVDLRDVRRAACTTPIDETHPQRPINAYGETKLAVERALPHFERATASDGWRCGTSTRPAPIPTAVIGEDHTPEEHLIPRAIAAASGGTPLVVLRRRLPDARRHLHPRLRPRRRPGARRTSWRWRARGGRRLAAYNLGNGDGMSVRQVIERGRTGDGPAGAAQRRPPPAGRSGAARRLERTASRRSSAGRPRFADLDTIVRDGLAVACGRTRTATASGRSNSTDECAG